jgi:nicotinamide-nucleotide amidase
MTSLFPADLYADAEALLAELQRHALLIVTAESCTGGLLAGLLTEVPGLIARHGAVSAEVARAMADGALARTPAHIALSVTGIAGPDGGSPEKPVGLVYFAVAAEGETTRVHERRFGDIGRREVRLGSVREAVALARSAVKPGLRHA